MTFWAGEKKRVELFHNSAGAFESADKVRLGASVCFSLHPLFSVFSSRSVARPKIFHSPLIKSGCALRLREISRTDASSPLRGEQVTRIAKRVVDGSQSCAARLRSGSDRAEPTSTEQRRARAERGNARQRVTVVPRPPTREVFTIVVRRTWRVSTVDNVVASLSSTARLLTAVQSCCDRCTFMCRHYVASIINSDITKMYA